MNFIHRNDHLGSYRRVNNIGYQYSNRVKNDNKIHNDSKFPWKKKNYHTTSELDWITIKIGGICNSNQKKNYCSNRIKTTKYSLYSFLPLNLLQQFQRIANFYFLVMTILGLLIDGPVSPLTSLLPLMFVISVTAAKQGYEDYLRYKTDNIVNFSPVTIIRNGEPININCQDIKLGDIVIVYRNCDVPCDLVLLKSSNINRKCLITTVNLDGESNIKTLLIPRGLSNVQLNNIHTLGIIVCEKAKSDLYSFNGKIILNTNDAQYFNELDDNILPLTTDNLLLRGSRVKGTEYVIGCAVYTGMNTKITLNSRLTKNKLSSNECHINKFLLFILCILVGFATFSFILKRYYENTIIINHNYLGPPIDTKKISVLLKDILSFIILFNYLIPISLYVTIELTRVIGTFFMEWDQNLYDIDTNQPCMANTSNLNEELGQINILFSDKTGTLTKNEMVFQYCSINCKKYKYFKSQLCDEQNQNYINILDWNEDHIKFFQALSVCHTVQLASDNQSINDDDDAASRNETLLNIISFSKICEENQLDNSQINNNQKLTETDETDTVIVKDKHYFNQVKKRNNSIKRSPKFREQLSNNSSNLNNNKISPVHGSTSQINIPPRENLNSHRRTVSYGANPVSSQRPVAKPSLFRSMSAMESRASYASPNFITSFEIDSMKLKGIQRVIAKLDYQASSPDEKALLEGCGNLGFVYMGETNDVIKIRICPPKLDYIKPNCLLQCKEIYFVKLGIIEFTSERKRMSVVVSDCDNNVWVYTKGAESYVLPLCSYQLNGDKIEKTNQHVTEFARQGLRTLVIARKQLTQEQYNEFKCDLANANQDILNRKKLLESCYDKIETDLEILGATAVEDLLQDDLSKSIVKLKQAGMKIWILTGDKVETALNIGISCGHISSDSQKYIIVGCQNKELLESYLHTFENDINQNPNQLKTFIIDGISLKLLLKLYPKRLCDLTIQCNAVLCCRLTPLQKCELVSLVKKYNKNFITAAIGDGANDVSMLQEAHIGIGIVGKEGRQAATCADFAIAKFNMLPRLVLVHGHYSNIRLSLLLMYFFYKEIVFMGIQFIYQFHSIFSTVSIYDSIFMTLYNVIYTALPILYISATEKNFSEEILMTRPELYKRNLNNRGLRWTTFLLWLSIGAYHSLVSFYITYYVYADNLIFRDGFTADFSSFGISLIQNVVIITNFKLWLETTYHSYILIFVIFLSIGGFILTTYIYNIINIRFDTDMFWSYNTILSNSMTYLIIIFIIFTSLLPDFTIRVLKFVLNIPKISNAKNILKNKLKRHNIISPSNPVESTYL